MKYLVQLKKNVADQSVSAQEAKKLTLQLQNAEDREYTWWPNTWRWKLIHRTSTKKEIIKTWENASTDPNIFDKKRNPNEIQRIPRREPQVPVCRNAVAYVGHKRYTVRYNTFFLVSLGKRTENSPIKKIVSRNDFFTLKPPYFIRRSGATFVAIRRRSLIFFYYTFIIN